MNIVVHTHNKTVKGWVNRKEVKDYLPYILWANAIHPADIIAIEEYAA